MRIVLTGGGTGGHLTPLISVADSLKKLYNQKEINIPKNRNSNLEIMYVGVVTDVDKALLEKSGIPYEYIPSGKIRRYLSGAALTTMDLLINLPVGIIKALWRMYVLMPEVVFSKGGYGSIPVVAACWIYRIPVLLHETDVMPGLANRKLSRFVSSIAVGFRKAEQYFQQEKVFVSGTPLRTSFYSLPIKDEAKKQLSLHDRKPIIFVTGGSQGAMRINNVILELLTKILPEFQIVHQVGQYNLEAVENFIKTTMANFPDITDYHPLGFVDEKTMVACFVAADMVIGRAGGTTLAEISEVGRPSILVPLAESANNHQFENAYFYREAGAAIVVDESNLSAPLLESTIRRAFQRQSDLDLMSERAKELRRPSASEDIAQLLITMGCGFVPRKKKQKIAQLKSL